MMRWLSCLLWLLLIWPAAGHASRQSTELTAGWTFKRGEVVGAEQPAFDDRNWDKVTLPHSFNAGDGEQPDYYRGPVWYRRAFDVRSVRAGRRLFVQFDGAATAADVYLNGKLVGRHEGGHAAFRFDLTDAIIPGRNLLAVRVDNSPTRVIAPLAGDFTIFGGLYRPVSLIETDEFHVDLLDHGGPGIRARATRITDSSAEVAVTARVANDGRRTQRVRVLARILDAGGQEVARAATTLSAPPRSVRVASLDMRIPNPSRWDGVRDPYLYSLVTRIGENGDEVTVPLGIRTFRIDPAHGFILNDRPYPLRGANLQHSARPGIGNAVSREQIAEDFAILREMGSTGVRLAHFQHPRTAYEEADRLGLGVWTEVGVVGEIEVTPAFRDNAAQQLRELIAQTYNHPSVMMWGLGNEVYADDPRVTRVLEGLHRVAKEADPGRPTVYAHCCQADDHPKALVSDAIGFNRYFGWYKDQGPLTMDSWTQRFHAAHPHRAFAVSEYGAGASIRHQADPPGAVDPPSSWHPEQYQTEFHEQNWRTLSAKPYLFATFIWVGFDFVSAGRHEGDRRGINDKGLVTHDRKTRKDAWYWYQANWSDRPMLHITSRRFTARHDPTAEVKAYTNAGPATLLVNGVEVGAQAPIDHILRWLITLREGLNRIEVRGAAGLVDRAEWSYCPAPEMLSRPPG
jgi:hypothetical protein